MVRMDLNGAGVSQEFDSPSGATTAGRQKRAALHLRVSSGQQTFENQRPELVRLARLRGLEIVAVYEEKESAAKTRPEFDRMMVAAHQGRFDVLLVWSLDRFGRSMSGNLSAVLKLDGLRIATLSAREPWLATEGPTRGLLIAVFSWVAGQERLRISERTKVALDRVRAEGRQLGRPRARVDILRALILIEGKGHSVREAAKLLGIGASTLHRALAEHRAVLNSQRPAIPNTLPEVGQPGETTKAA